MKLTKALHRPLLWALVLGSGLMANPAEAGIARVINTAKNDIITRVVPEPSSEESTYCWSCLGGCLDTQCRMKEIVVPANALKEHESFAIVGTEGGILFTGSCHNLSAHKNYKVVFFDTFAGVSCQSTEI